MSAPPHADARIWMDGRLLPWAAAQVHVLAHSLHYGSGVFEGLRAYAGAGGPALFRLRDHTERLLASAACVGMAVPYGAAALDRACIEAVRANRLGSAYVRPICFFGNGFGLSAEGLQVHVAVAAWEWASYLGAEGLERGIRVQTSDIVRDRVNRPLNHSKICGNYLYSTVATARAKAAGYDEALLLERDGRVSEGSGENLFLVRGGALATPAPGSALDGITRRTVLELAREDGLATAEARLTRADVLAADEAFFTGTAAEVTPIRELDGAAIGDGRRGPVTTRLQRRYQDLVAGRCGTHPEWRTPVA